MDRLDPRALGTILSVWAHPDDETYLAGALMAAAADAGQRVVCVSATAGERGTADPEAWPPARLGQLRRWETLAAMAVLGVGDHRFLGLPDGGLAELDHAAGVAMIGDLLDEIAPDTVLTFGPDGMTFHTDHITVSRWVTEAWQERGCPGRLLYAVVTDDHLIRFAQHYEDWDMYMSDERPTGVTVDSLAVHLVAAGPALDRKLAALGAMASQTRDVMASLDPATFAAEIAEECFIAAPPMRVMKMG